MTVILLLTVGASCASKPNEKHFGSVSVSLEKGGIALMSFDSWESDALLMDVDSALSYAHEAQGLILRVPRCKEEYAPVIAELRARLTPFKLGENTPAKVEGWDRPLVIVLPDSFSCMLLWQMRMRRWTEVLSGDDAKKAHERMADMIRRWKRERVERMEKMFQK